MRAQKSTTATTIAVVTGLEDELQQHGCRIEGYGLRLPADLSEGEWGAIGQTIYRLHNKMPWLWGDWWSSVNFAYGQRTAILQANGWEDLDFSTLANYGSVARAFGPSRRREHLSFSHHDAVANKLLSETEVAALLDWAEETIAETGKPRSVRALRAERDRREEEKAAASRPPPRTVTIVVSQWTPEMAAAQQAAYAAAMQAAQGAAISGAQTEPANDTRRATEPAPSPVQRPTAAEAPRDDEDDEAARRMVAAAKDALTLRLSERMRARLMRAVAELLNTPVTASFH